MKHLTGAFRRALRDACRNLEKRGITKHKTEAGAMLLTSVKNGERTVVPFCTHFSAPPHVLARRVTLLLFPMRLKGRFFIILHI